MISSVLRDISGVRLDPPQINYYYWAETVSCNNFFLCFYHASGKSINIVH